MIILKDHQMITNKIFKDYKMISNKILKDYKMMTYKILHKWYGNKMQVMIYNSNKANNNSKTLKRKCNYLHKQ